MIKELKPQGYYTDKVFTPAEMDDAIAKEREACAKECEQTALRMGSEWMAQHCAKAIRARGEA